jgi:hypothetical protein
MLLPCRVLPAMRTLFPNGLDDKARNETRTRDPFLTMEVLYQLSYPGEAASSEAVAQRF